jgi:hypothetical protein
MIVEPFVEENLPKMRKDVSFFAKEKRESKKTAKEKKNTRGDFLLSKE